MNEITKSKKFGNLIAQIQELETELSELFQERDKILYHICPKLKAEYMLKIGKLEYAIFEYQCKTLRTKRKIEIIQAALNREESYNITKIDKQLDKEYHEYTNKLIEKQKEIDEARSIKKSLGKPLTEKESSELKKVYTLIVKKLHPDINPDTTEEQRRQFNDAVDAYKKADLSELKIIYLLIEKTSATETPNSMEKLEARKKLLHTEKENLNNSIHKIKEAFPYCIKDLLLDETKMQNKIDELSKLLTEYREQFNNLENRLEQMIK